MQPDLARGQHGRELGRPHGDRDRPRGARGGGVRIGADHELPRRGEAMLEYEVVQDPFVVVKGPNLLAPRPFPRRSQDRGVPQIGGRHEVVGRDHHARRIPKTPQLLDEARQTPRSRGIVHDHPIGRGPDLVAGAHGRVPGGTRQDPLGQCLWRSAHAISFFSP
jgi:hypothetical protein